MASNVNMTNEEYSSYVDTKTKNISIIKNIIWAFVVCGLICTIGQLITNLFMYFGCFKDDTIMKRKVIVIINNNQFFV